MGRRPMVATAALGAVLLCSLLLVARADAAIYWGAVINGEVYGETGAAPANTSAWGKFEDHAGKRTTLVSLSQDWGRFETDKFEAARSHGSIPVVAMGLPEGVTLEEVANGDQDASIKAWARAAKAYGTPFLFAPWREMNGAWYSWGQDPNFVPAWRHFHDLVTKEGATNVTWVWVVNQLWYDPASEPGPYYPGDEYVDWVGMDGYNWGRNPVQPDRWLSPEQELSPTLARLKAIAPGKPVCLCENASSEDGGDKPAWIRNMLSTYLPQHPAIKAYVYFDWNLEQNGGRFDWPIESSAPSQEAFRAGIQSAYYRSTLPPLTPLQKVPLPPASTGAAAPQAADISQTGGNAQSPAVAMSPGGAATVVWTRSDGAATIVEERRIEPDGTSGPTHDLSEPGRTAAAPQVAVAADGTATVVWARTNGSTFAIQARRVTSDGLPETDIRELSSGRGNALEPEVAVAGDGLATVVWSRFEEGAEGIGSSQIVEERRLSAEGVPEASVHQLSNSGRNAIEPRVSGGPNDTATVVWTRSDGESFLVQERRILESGEPAAATGTLSAAGRSAVEPQVEVAGDGSAIVVWSRWDGSNWTVQACGLSATGSAGTPVALSAPGGSAYEPQPSVTPGTGSVNVVWDRRNGANTIVQRRRVSASGTAEGAVEDLSLPGQDATEPQVAASGEGVVFVWRRFDGAEDVVQVTSRERPPPPSEPVQTAAPTPTAPSGSGSHAPPTLGSFALGRPRLNLKRGTALLPVVLPQPGALRIRGRGIVGGEVLRRVGRSAIVIRPGRRVRVILRTRGRARVRVTVVFQPTGESTGGSVSRSATMTLRMR